MISLNPDTDGPRGFVQRVPKQLCPQCGHTLNMAGSLEEKVKPIAGDLLVCIRCASLLRYRKNLHLRPVPKKEFDTLPKEVQQVVAQIQFSIRQMPGKPPGDAN